MVMQIKSEQQQAHGSLPSTSKATDSSRPWSFQASPAARRAENPIRKLAATIDAQGGPSGRKPLINLGMGDPTAYELQAPPAVAVEALRECLTSGKANGYVPGAGDRGACEAVARYHRRWDGVQYEGRDIVLTTGATQALDLIFGVLVSPGQNVLLPRPNFPAYKNLLGLTGAEIRYYDCVPERGWECDLAGMEAQIDERTAFVLVCNPGNPTGVCLPPSHLQRIVDLLERIRGPLLVADEIYGHMTWGTGRFQAMASMTTSLPTITVSGLSKRFLVPGWRCGWIALHDPLHIADPIRRGLGVFADRVLGPPTPIQRALPRILDETTAAWFDLSLSKLARNAAACDEALSGVPGLFCTRPNAAMYLLLGLEMRCFPAFGSDVEFAAALVSEENLFMIPGSAFGAVDHLRLVIAASPEVLEEACRRISEFAGRHYVGEGELQ